MRGLVKIDEETREETMKGILEQIDAETWCMIERPAGRIKALVRHAYNLGFAQGKISGKNEPVKCIHCRNHQTKETGAVVPVSLCVAAFWDGVHVIEHDVNKPILCDFYEEAEQ